MAVSDTIKKSIENSSWIREMFETGARLKSVHGEENVFDFSLGNPDVKPPEKFFSTLKKLSSDTSEQVHRYMPNAGFKHVRESMAKKVSREHCIEIDFNSIVMTCGAAGGLNVIFKTILNEGEEVIVPSPYFVEYSSYASNHRGKIVLVDCKDDFLLDLEKIKEAINKKTRAVLINSPNNPTGRIYPEEQIRELSEILKKRNNGDIYLISDEPYREIVYDGKTVPCILPHYPQSLVVTSFSKSLSIAGERLGFIAANPGCSEFELLMGGLILSNRILGFVNAPALMQRIAAELTDAHVDVDTYQRKRDLLIDGLESSGYKFIRPDGAFYLFCESPVDDVDFVKHLQGYNILTVPGTGFGKPGYFRISFSVPEDTITRSIEKFREAMISIK